MINFNLLLLFAILYKSQLSLQAIDCNASDECSSEEESLPKPSSAIEKDPTNTYNPTCQFYLAPSSIPNAGFGIYTVKSIPKGELIMHKADAPSIVAPDADFHNLGKEPIWAHSNYFWAGEGWAEYEGDSVYESVVTFGAMCNFHTYLYNVKPTVEIYDDSLTPRQSGSPGMGAYSYYGGYNFKAVRDIAAGDEVFAHYGESWLEGRAMGKVIPTESDFVAGGKIVGKVWDGIGNGTDSKVLEAINNVVKLFSPRTASILPSTQEQLNSLSFTENDKPEANEDNVTIDKSQDDDSRSKILAKNTVLPRSIPWILSEGVCLDNLISGISTLPDAGKGAFAQRFIPKNSMVVPAPLLQIPHQKVLLMYALNSNSDGTLIARSGNATASDNEIIGTQLLINYCFSHHETPLLLCPQSNAILINHCSSRTSYGGDCKRYNAHKDVNMRGPNAYVRWGTTWDPDVENWLKMDLTEIETKTKSGKRGLSMEIIAARDIFPGDEVFIDYGELWEKKWDEHVRNWQPPFYNNYAPVKEMNEKVHSLRTREELEVDPYPDNVKTGCVYWIEELEPYDESGSENLYVDSEWVTDDGMDYTLANNIEGWHWPCEILKRDESGEVYTVQIYQSVSSDTTKWAKAGQDRIINNFPRSSINFFTKKRSSDQHVRGAFRQPIGIPDEMVPIQWKVKAGEQVLDI